MKKYIYSIAQKILPYKLERKPENTKGIVDPQVIEGNLKDGISGSLSIVYEIILDILKHFPIKGQFGLDIGTGTAVLLKKIASLFPQIQFIGIDTSKQMVELACKLTQDTPNISIVEINALELKKNFSKGYFDIITWNLGLHHCLTINEAAEIIQQAYELLEDDGIFLIFDIQRPKTIQLARWFADNYNRFQNEAYYKDAFNSYLAAFSYSELEDILQSTNIKTYLHISPIVANIFQYVLIYKNQISILPQSYSVPNFSLSKQLEDYLFLRKVLVERPFKRLIKKPKSQ